VKCPVKTSPEPVVSGVENVWIGVITAPKAIDMGECEESGGVPAYANMYMQILEINAGSLQGHWSSYW
jgi:hypothetical protein